MSVFVLDRMVDDESESSINSRSDVSNLVVHLGLVLENQGHSLCEHVHAPANASPPVYTGALEDPFF